jgi:hypothetical protein
VLKFFKPSGGVVEPPTLNGERTIVTQQQRIDYELKAYLNWYSK